MACGHVHCNLFIHINYAMVGGISYEKKHNNILLIMLFAYAYQIILAEGGLNVLSNSP